MRAWTYHELLGEINYASKFYGRGLSQVEFLASELVDGEWVESTNAQAVEAVARLQIPAWIDAYGTMMFLVGEGLLLLTQAEGGEETWEFLSTDELKVTPGGRYQRIGAPGLTPHELQEAPEDATTLLPEQAVVYRLWSRHPRYSMLADAPMHGVLDLCEELVLLTAAIRARSLNRSAGNGWLIIPEEASYIGPAVGDEDSDEDPFMKDLTDAMTANIAEPGTSSAVVPLISRMKGDEIAKIRHVVFQQMGQDPYPEGEVRSDTIKRLAIGLDMPPEILLGLADSNHWTAWQIDEQVWEAHLLPVTLQLCNDLTKSYLRPTLEKMGLDAKMFMVGYNEAAVVKRPDRSADAKDLHDRGALSDRALREANAFDEDDMPTETDPNTNPHVIIAQARASAGGGPLEVTGDTTPPPAAPAAAALLSAASVALGRCRELAGARIRTKASRFPAVESSIDRMPNERVAAQVGKANLNLLGLNPTRLVEGGAKNLLGPLADLGYPPDAALCVCAAVERYAAMTLFDAEPSGVPLELLEEPCALSASE